MALKISRVLQAGYIFEWNGIKIIFDPLFENPFSQNCYAFPEVQFDLEAVKKLKFDAVFISHFHEDHCSLESLNLIHRETPVYLYCLHEELFEWIRELGFKNVISLRLNHKVQIGEISVTSRRALDADTDSLFQIRAAELNVLNVVDSWIDLDTLDLLDKEGPWDLILWPFQTLRELEVLMPDSASPSDGKIPVEWLEQIELLKPRYLVPSSCQFKMESWSWYNKAFFPISYKSFAEQVGGEVIKLNPGCSYELTSAHFKCVSPLSWIKYSADCDYEYDPNAVPTPTSEIAKHFPALDIAELQLVKDFCRSIKTEINWQLKIFDSSGSELQFGSSQPDWVTEIPAFKLYGALKNGESLTSIYLRIKTSLPDADPLADPLVMALYNSGFGAYQHEQLLRLQAARV